MTRRSRMTRRHWLQATGTGLVGAALGPGAAVAQAEWTPLFDGSQLGKWEQTSFGGEGPVSVVDGAIVLGMGDPLTGITWTGAPRATGVSRSRSRPRGWPAATFSAR